MEFNITPAQTRDELFLLSDDILEIAHMLDEITSDSSPAVIASLLELIKPVIAHTGLKARVLARSIAVQDSSIKHLQPQVFERLQ